MPGEEVRGSVTARVQGWRAGSKQVITFSEETRKEIGKKSERPCNGGARKLKAVLTIGCETTVC